LSAFALVVSGPCKRDALKARARRNSPLSVIPAKAGIYELIGGVSAWCDTAAFSI
jgi:hypothetical protein